MKLLSELLAVATGFTEFRVGKVEGLWRDAGERMDILAIVVTDKGKGHGGTFIDALQWTYRVVRFLHVDSPLLRVMLLRRGFAEVSWFEDGERVEGMRWSREGEK
jgi:hypothetical protein